MHVTLQKSCVNFIFTTYCDIQSLIWTTRRWTKQMTCTYSYIRSHWNIKRLEDLQTSVAVIFWFDELCKYRHISSAAQHSIRWGIGQCLEDQKPRENFILPSFASIPISFASLCSLAALIIFSSEQYPSWPDSQTLHIHAFQPLSFLICEWVFLPSLTLGIRVYPIQQVKLVHRKVTR